VTNRRSLFVTMCLYFTNIGAADAGTVHVEFETRAPQWTPADNVWYYDRVAILYHDDTTRFDADHPFYGRLFEDSRLTDELLSRMRAHERRFEYWSPNLYRFLDGYSFTHPIYDGGIPRSVLSTLVDPPAGSAGDS
jgi:hypothetical protein